MDERPIHTDQDNHGSPRRRRRLVAALAVTGMLAAVPAGVALAGGSDESNARGSDGSSVRDGDRGDCPEKDGQGGQESTQL